MFVGNSAALTFVALLLLLAPSRGASQGIGNLTLRDFDAHGTNSTGLLSPAVDATRGLIRGYPRQLQGSCGGGSHGNGICSTPGLCCSQYGWCGTSAAHCAGSTPSGPSGGGTCGGGSRGNGVCSTPGLCCSQYGWCGTSAAHCAGSTPSGPTGPAPSPPSGGGTCGGGSRGNGICSTPGLCCSQYGWCGTSAAHCAGSTPSGPTGPAPSPPSGGGGQSAYVTYHFYNPGQGLNTVSCSDGANGLITRWGYQTIDPMLPMVTATSLISWNSPTCGACFRLTANGNTIYVTAIDGSGGGAPGQTHFDLHPTAFNNLLGSAGVAAGSGTATYAQVASSNCRGNLG